MENEEIFMVFSYYALAKKKKILSFFPVLNRKIKWRGGGFYFCSYLKNRMTEVRQLLLG